MFKPVKQEGLSLSIRNGVYMPFIYKGHQVVVHNASWSFRETITVDDEVVVTRIGISMNSTHTVEVAGDQLTITFGWRNRMNNLFVQATVDGKIVHELDHQIHADKKSWSVRLLTLIGIALGGFLGYHFGYWLVTAIGGA